MIKIEISFVNGSFQEWEENESIIDDFNRLAKEGYKGKSLVNILISDDWGVPPLFVSLKGILSSGYEFSESIRYE